MKLGRGIAIMLLAWVGLFPVASFAVPVFPPSPTAEFVEKASEILVVECLNPGFELGPKEDGMTLIEVKIVHVIKGDRVNGNRPLGKTRLATIGQPMQSGKRYMLASFGGDAFGTGFVAQSEQAVVELPADFDLATVTKTDNQTEQATPSHQAASPDKSPRPMTAVEQVNSIVTARRTEVERQLRLLEREQQTLGGFQPRK
ncbi:MAG: hypothetical protein SFX18_11700 [Pirellulales bacterium]|nr:hypothetical protein [Pirellulales bacterium]